MKTPERIYIQLVDDGVDTFESTWCESRIEDEDIEYIRKDIVLDMMEQSVVKGFEHAVKGNNLFTKEQVVELMKKGIGCARLAGLRQLGSYLIV